MKKSKTIVDKNKNDNSSTLGIKHFFQSAPTSHQVNKNGKPKDKDDTKAFYVDLLKKKLQKVQNTGETEQREVELVGTSVQRSQNFGFEQVEPVSASAENEIKSVAAAKSQCTGCEIWEDKYKSLKKDYMKLGASFAELRIKYDDLLDTKTYPNTNSSDTNDVASICDAIFTPGEIEVLRNMSLKQKNDSSFILNCLKYAHNDLSVLSNRTLKGTPESMVISDDGDVAYMPGKDPLSPQKIKAIRSLFVERINKCNLKPEAYGNRIKDAYMNKLIASGITNIGKIKKNSQ